MGYRKITKNVCIIFLNKWLLYKLWYLILRIHDNLVWWTQYIWLWFMIAPQAWAWQMKRNQLSLSRDLFRTTSTSYTQRFSGFPEPLFASDSLSYISCTSYNVKLTALGASFFAGRVVGFGEVSGKMNPSQISGAANKAPTTIDPYKNPNKRKVGRGIIPW